MSCYITYNNKNYTEKDFKEYLKSVLAEKQNTSTETKTRMGISYVEEDLKSKSTGAKMLAATNGKTIKINPNISVDEFFEYFLGNVEGKYSAQKKEVLARISKLGYPESVLREMLNTEDKIKDFLVLHEQDHINNDDAKVYWAQGKEDLMTPDKIDIEVRATLEALNIIRDGVEVKPPVIKPIVKSEFTHNGITIPTDFPLGLQQTQALKQIIDYIEDPSKYPFYTLQGYAGTGKTTVIGYVQRYYEKKGGNEVFRYIAPTHAATAQLAVTTSKLGNTNLPATVRATAFMGKDFKGNPKPSLSRKMSVSDYQIGIYIIDEASMLAQKDLDILVAAVKAQDGVVIFMGDNKQIPEVDARNPSKKEMNSAFQTDNTLTLDTVYRQSESDLLDTLTEIRDRNFFEPTISITNEDGSLQVLNKKDYATSIVKDFKEDLEGSVYIAYTNAAVTAFNASMKEQLNGEKEPVVGEKIVGYAGNNDKKIEDRDMANSVSYTISEIKRKDPEGSRFTIMATSSLLQTLVDRGIDISNTAIANYVQLSAQDSFTFNGVTQEHMDNTNKELSASLEPLYKQYIEAIALPNSAYKWQHIEDIKANVDKIVGRRNQFGNEYLYDPMSNKIVLKSSVEPSKISPAQRDVFKMSKGVDYGYAITAHKAQGMTVNNAYVDVENISNSGSNTPITIKGEQVNTEKNALYYVAMSRAKNKVVLKDNAVQRSSETQTEQKEVVPTSAPKQPTVFTPEMIRARVKNSFDANGYMDIKETSRGDKVILGAITKYIMATKGIVTNNQIIEASKTFKLKDEVTIETVKEGVLRIKIKESLLEGDGDAGLFGGLDMSRLTSSGESMANNIFKVKEGVSEVFKDNESLAFIGTEQQYSQYLDTIFPNSKIKDILYHGTDKSFTNFNIPKQREDKFPGIYLSSDKEESKFYSEEQSNIIKDRIRSQSPDFLYKLPDFLLNTYFNLKIKSKLINIKPRIIPVLINTDKLQIIEVGEESVSFNNNPNKENQDKLFDKLRSFSNNINTVVYNNYLDSTIISKVVSVRDPNQIHILGSKQDIEGFKDFVSKNKSLNNIEQAFKCK